MVNKNRLISLTQRLIKINSENPPGNEFQIANFVKDYLNKLGLKTRIYAFKNRRANVVAILEGRNKKSSLFITPHLDTVPAGQSWSINPFSAKVQRNRIYGLGATDCKGNLAACIEAINSIVEEKIVLDYKLIFAATADEESGSNLGLIPLLDKGILKPKLALILDGTNFEIIVTQKGLMHLKIKIWGRRSHGAYPERGINAIDIAVGIIRALKAHKFSYIKNKYLKPPTINIGTIRGGDKVNIVADWCEFEVDFRFLPGMSARKLLKQIKNIVNKHAKLSAKIEVENIQEPYAISKVHPLVVELKKAMRKLKVKPIVSGSEGATVVTFFQHKNIPAIAYGFGSTGLAHTADEYVKIDNLYKGALVLEEFLKIGVKYGRN